MEEPDLASDNWSPLSPWSAGSGNGQIGTAMSLPSRLFFFFDTSVILRYPFCSFDLFGLQVSVLTASGLKCSHNAKSQEENRKAAVTQTLNGQTGFSRTLAVLVAVIYP